MPEKVLIILHQERSIPGRVGYMLRRRGYELDIRRPRFGDPLPETMDDHAGAVIFGGPMSANDSDDYVRTETDWLSVPLKEKAPFLGICLGAQMLARHLGGKVAFHDDGNVEVGYYPLVPTQAGVALGPWPARVYQWHREGIEAPSSGVDVLAEGETFSCQAFRAGPAAYAIQFHPEVTLAMMYRWTTHAAHRMALPGAASRAEHFADRFVYDNDNIAWLERFLDIWLKSGAR